MTNEEILKIRELLQEELRGKGVALEFADLVKVDDANPGLIVEDRDITNPAEEYVQTGELDDFLKIFTQENLQKGSRNSVARSRMAPTKNNPPESQPEEQSCEEFFDCEKRSSSRSTVKLFKRFIPETNEIAIEAFDYRGACTSTRFVSAAEIPEDSPLGKSEIMSQMFKTLNQVRNSMTAEDVKLVEKAIRSLDVSAFLELVRRTEITA